MQADPSVFVTVTTFESIILMILWSPLWYWPSQLYLSYHSFRKRKDSLEGSLDRVLLAAEIEFMKLLVPRLPQHTSNVNTKCAGKSEWSKQLYSLYVTSFLEH